MMQSITVFRAQDSYEGQDVSGFRIETGVAIPEGDESKYHFEHDAMMIVQLLWSSLPGGTVDRILGLMLERRRSQLVVPMPDSDADTLPPEPSTD